MYIYIDAYLFKDVYVHFILNLLSEFRSKGRFKLFHR